MRNVCVVIKKRGLMTNVFLIKEIFISQKKREGIHIFLTILTRLRRDLTIISIGDPKCTHKGLTIVHNYGNIKIHHCL